MRRLLAPLALALGLIALAATADAACYADYKAKMDDPLRLHYGVIELPGGPCTKARAQQVVAQRIAADGWTLLNIVSTFGEEGLESRRGQAGAYFLRY